MTPESLVYSISLYYNPTPAANAIIVRTSPAEVPIECHYPRRNNVSSKAIKPTWEPFTSTLSAEQKLTFSLRLMNGISRSVPRLTVISNDWSTERTSNGFQLGDVMYIQADVNTENHIYITCHLKVTTADQAPDRENKACSFSQASNM
ncbi:hypothetical protein JD844_014245 [Phrynosoma platyrhinos]|uniref:ZP domain-containing protein n=1 Tax=Phrynosoma platyrhinos TaxID=52577 RepID=A0ABQ7SRB9_PHRPL|nr:hypothetical protein JD844_014245 [Phrynosoma platyrhinos]